MDSTPAAIISSGRVKRPVEIQGHGNTDEDNRLGNEKEDLVLGVKKEGKDNERGVNGHGEDDEFVAQAHIVIPYFSKRR